jgi:ubiquinone/menaquinone biosynthesis C-methylase UbiE
VTFHDHFSRVAAGYARHRPHYPEALFDWLAASVPDHALAWDCATGSGQAAVGLASRFARVVATDASDDQLRHATPRPTIEYRCAPADRSGLDEGSADLVTCAQALHWLPRDRFFAEARRVLRPTGLIAVWGYHIPLTGDPPVDAAIRRFHDEVVGPYWPPERRLVLDRFATIDFPFDAVPAPDFAMRCDWTLDDFAHYLGTQSATDRYRRANGGADPVPAFAADVEIPWGGRATRRDVRFPIFMRAGRP